MFENIVRDKLKNKILRLNKDKTFDFNILALIVA